MEDRQPTTFFILNHQQVTHEAQLIADLSAVPDCQIERVPVANEITSRLANITGNTCIVFNAVTFDTAALMLIEAFSMLFSSVTVIIVTANVEKEHRKRIRKLKHLVLLEGAYDANTFRELCEKVTKGQEVYQRSHERYPTSQAVELEVLSSKTTFRALMRNMSRGGAYFDVDAEAAIEEGDLVKITIQLDQLSRAHQVYGEVMRYAQDAFGPGKAGFGIRYISSDELFSALRDKSK